MVVLATVAVAGLGLHELGVKIVGVVPGGLPSVVLPALSPGDIRALLPAALTISFVSFMESIAVAKSIAAREKYKIEANRELVGLGAANLAAGLFSGYPVTGGFSRSAVNYQAGARTPLAGIISALLIMLTLLFFTPLFEFLPKAVLAAIVMVAVSGLVDLREAQRLFRVKPIDGWTLVVTFAATLILGVEPGILAGVAFSLLVFVWRSAYPHTAELGRLEAQGVFRNVERFPEARTSAQLLMVRPDASLYFANMGFLENWLVSRSADRPGLRLAAARLQRRQRGRRGGPRDPRGTHGALRASRHRGPHRRHEGPGARPGLAGGLAEALRQPHRPPVARPRARAPRHRADGPWHRAAATGRGWVRLGTSVEPPRKVEGARVHKVVVGFRIRGFFSASSGFPSCRA